MALGLAQAGFESVHASDGDPSAVETLRQVVPHAEQLMLDVEGAAALGQSLRHYGIDLVAAGPPCPPFSSAGRRLGKDDPRDGFPALLALVRTARPRAVLIENVRGLVDRKQRPYFDQILNELAWAGYDTQDRKSVV